MTIKKEIANRLNIFLISASGLVAALAWNEAVQSLFKEGGILFFIGKSGVWAYAVFVTIIAVLVTIWITKLSQKIK